MQLQILLLPHLLRQEQQSRSKAEQVGIAHAAKADSAYLRTLLQAQKQANAEYKRRDSSPGCVHFGLHHAGSRQRSHRQKAKLWQGPCRDLRAPSPGRLSMQQQERSQ